VVARQGWGLWGPAGAKPCKAVVVCRQSNSAGQHTSTVPVPFGLFTSLLEEYRLEVNVPKCAVVVFGQRAVRIADLPPGGWLFAGQPVPLVTEFRYLAGVFPSDSRGVFISLCPALSWFACHAGLAAEVWCWKWSLRIHVQLFDALRGTVAPVLGSCADIWGATLIWSCLALMGCMDTDLHEVQGLFMRQMGEAQHPLAAFNT